LTFLKNISPAEDAPDAAGDQELIAAYRQSSDLKVLAELYLRYLDLLFGVCLKYLGEREAAKDAVMEIFELLSQKLLKHEVTHFKGWLYTLARNHCLMQLRSSTRVKIQSFDPELMQTEEDLHLTEVQDKEARLVRLSKCLETLSAEQKTTVSLFYLENKCYKEIETITGLDWNKVRSHIQNGRRNLKICLQRQEIGRDPFVGEKLGLSPEIRNTDPEGKDPALAV
jgi:RNA polymerase sigma-70 factor (ECF subfamily)